MGYREPGEVRRASVERTEPSAIEYVVGSFITISVGVGAFLGMMRVLPSTLPELEEIWPQATLGGMLASAVAVLLLCPAILGWSLSEGRWGRASRTERWTRLVFAILIFATVGPFFVFFEIDPV